MQRLKPDDMLSLFDCSLQILCKNGYSFHPSDAENDAAGIIIFFLSCWPKLGVSHKYGVRDRSASDTQGNSGLLACDLGQIVLFPEPQFPDPFIHSFN